jgi:hypothetical protein
VGIKEVSGHCQNHLQINFQTIIMSAHQTELWAIRYLRLLDWFSQQEEMAPINAIHHTILWHVHQYLVDHADTWGSPDIRQLCVIGDAIVALYDRPQDVVDLTTEGKGEGDENGHGDDSGIMD